MTNNPQTRAQLPDMKTATLTLFILTTAVLFSPSSHAAIKKFKAPDFSGQYTCTGNDAKEGAYTATVRLEIDQLQSQGVNGAYRFVLEVPGFGSYPGHAASDGKVMAIYFANMDSSTQDYGTGIARFKKNRHGKWTFSKYYYEPEFKGGNFGFENCVQQ